MKKLKAHNAFDEYRTHRLQKYGDMHFVELVREYRSFQRSASDFRRDMLFSCNMVCRARTWKGHYLRRINPPFLNIGMIHSGGQLIRNQSGYFLAEANDVMLFPPGCSFELLTPNKCEKSGMVLYGTLLNSVLRECGFTDCTILSLKNFDFLENCFTRLGHLIEEAHQFGARRQVAETCFKILQYLAAPDPDDHFPSALSAAMNLISEKYGEDLSVADMANAGEISESGITRLFRHHLDITPHRYLTEHRMRQAEMMLQDHSFLIKEVAARVGYNNSLNFSTEFKKFFGCSPKTFSNRIKMEHPKST